MKPVLIIAAITALISGCAYKVEKEADVVKFDPNTVGFAEVQAAVFNPKCSRCHGALMASYDSVLPKINEIQRRIHLPAGALNAMPPSGPLSADEIAIVDAWIARGAPEGEGVPAPAPEEPTQGAVPIMEGPFTLVREKVFVAKCVLCHGDMLTNYDSVVSKLDKIETRVQSAFDFEQMPPSTAEQLTQEERDILLDWIRAGAPNDSVSAPSPSDNNKP